MIRKDHNFSIVALKILPQCPRHIRKCLKSDRFYYFNNTYEIAPSGKTIKLRRKDLDPIGNSFFQIGHKDGPTISISAIVGKNGEGKSTLIELIVRLINNLAYKRGLDPNKHLMLIEDVDAELYYVLNNEFYCLRGEQISASDYKVDLYRYNYDTDTDCYCQGNSMKEEEIRKNFFYTLVSNYSHYAYNIEDFAKESPFLDDTMHWLQRVFHKNDAYQTPLNLHPYRDRGNIDINRENLLSKQRMLISITKSFVKSGNNYTTHFEINNKTPDSLILDYSGKSKLQEVVIRRYFKANRGLNLLNYELEKLDQYIENIDFSDRDVTILAHVSSIFTKLHNFISHLSPSNSSISSLEWFHSALEWADNRDLVEVKSDISLVMDRVKTILERESLLENEFSFEKILKEWDTLKRFSMIQIYRLVEILQILNHWSEEGMPLEERSDAKNEIDDDAKNWKVLKINVDPAIIFQDYDKLSDKARCEHYILYKTISIFETYPSYRYPVTDDVFQVIERWDKKNDRSLFPVFAKLGADWMLKSHITLKLRQTYNYFNGPTPTKDIYAIDTKEENIPERPISFSSMSEDAKVLMSDIETLPPAIFKWDINFVSKHDREYVSFNTFSSGEKQKIFCQSAVIYHLQNINSIASESIHYGSVNLIFEEIELYFHPEWQRTFIYEMIRMIKDANIDHIKSVNMLFVTHSPYILSDIPKSNVLFLRDGVPDYSMQENTFGANINSLLRNGFFLPNIPMGEFAYRKINSLFSILNNAGITTDNKDEILTEIMTVGDPAIRSQLIMLFSPYHRLFS